MKWNSMANFEEIKSEINIMEIVVNLKGSNLQAKSN